MLVTGKYWVILSPTSNKGKAASQQPVIERFLKENGINYELFLTKYHEDAIEIARELPLGNNDVVVAAGGDGNLSQVVNGVFSRPDASSREPIFGVLPLGRGNDVAIAIGIPDLEKALKALISGKIWCRDAGFVKRDSSPEIRYFTNVVGIGLDNKIYLEAKKMKIKGSITYILGSLICIARFEPSPIIQITYNDKEMTQPTTVVSVLVGKKMGNRFLVAPDAIVDDGFLDICVLRDPPNRLTLFKIFTRYLKGTHVGCEDVSMGKSTKFHLKVLTGGIIANCDGEIICYDDKEFEITCLPNALKIIGA